MNSDKSVEEGDRVRLTRVFITGVTQRRYPAGSTGKCKYAKSQEWLTLVMDDPRGTIRIRASDVEKT